MTDRAAILAMFGVTEDELGAFAAVDEATDAARAEVADLGQRLSERLEEIADELTLLLPGDLRINVVTWPGSDEFKGMSSPA